jgi:hypothetical protein
MKVANFVERFIYEAPVWKLISLIVIVMVFKTGIWCIPNLSSSRLIALNPFTNPFHDPNTHYLYWSWLAPFLAWRIGATGNVSFFLFHLFFSITFTVLFVTVAFARLTESEARTSLVLFSLLPVSVTSYFWVSMDSLTLTLMMLALTAPRVLPVVFFVGIALGMQHFEQSFCGAAAVLLALTISYRLQGETEYSARWALALVSGIILGKLTLVGLFHCFGVSINSGRLYWIESHFRLLLSQFFFHFHYLIWSVLGLGWVVAVKYLDYGTKSVPFFVSLFGLLGLLPISGDQTRVLAISTFFLVSVYWLLNPDFLRQVGNQFISWVFLVWLISPLSWARGGTPMWSVFPYDIAYLLHRVFGWFDVPADPAAWPF